MADRYRVVLDTNILVSALLKPASLPRQVVDSAIHHANIDILISEATFEELVSVLFKKNLSGTYHEKNGSLSLTRFP